MSSKTADEGVEASARRVRHWIVGKAVVRRVLMVDSFAALRPCKRMLKLQAASSCAKARPMPSVAPVMRAQGEGPWW